MCFIGHSTLNILHLLKFSALIHYLRIFVDDSRLPPQLPGVISICSSFQKVKQTSTALCVTFTWAIQKVLVAVKINNFDVAGPNLEDTVAEDMSCLRDIKRYFCIVC